MKSGKFTEQLLHTKDIAKKEYQLTIDEVAKIDDEAWNILDKRLNDGKID